MSAWKMYYVFFFTYIAVCFGNPTPCGSYLHAGRGTFTPTEEVIIGQSAVLHCNWNLFTTDDSKVLVQFIRLQLPSKDCSVDNVTIFDLDMDRKIGVFCGTEKQPSILSTRSQMRVTLNTISPLYSAPFVATYEPYQCGGLLTTSSGTFSSPLYPDSYPLNSDCRWTIVAPTPGLEITFPFFDVGLPSCTFEKVSIYEGADESAPLLDILCGSLKGRSYRTTGSSLHIVFRANQWTQRANGFEAIYKPIELTDQKYTRNTEDRAMGLVDDNNSSPDNLEARDIDENEASTDSSSDGTEINTDVQDHMNFDNSRADAQEHEQPSSPDKLELTDQSGEAETPVPISPATITTPIPDFSTGPESVGSNNTLEHATRPDIDNEKTVDNAYIPSSAMNSNSDLNQNQLENQNDNDQPKGIIHHRSMMQEENRLTQPVTEGNDDENNNDTWRADPATQKSTDELVPSTEPSKTTKPQGKVEELTTPDLSNNKKETRTNQTENDQADEHSNWTIQTTGPATDNINTTSDDGHSDTINSDPWSNEQNQYSTDDDEAGKEDPDDEEEREKREERKRSNGSDTKADERSADDQIAVTNVRDATAEEAASMVDSSMHESISPEDEVDQKHWSIPVFEPVPPEKYNLTSEGNSLAEESSFESEKIKEASPVNTTPHLESSSASKLIPTGNWNQEESYHEERSEEVPQKGTNEQSVQIDQGTEKKQGDISVNENQMDPSATSSCQDESELNSTSTQGTRDEPTVVMETPEQFESGSSQTEDQEEVTTPSPFQGLRTNQSEVTSSWTADTYRENQPDSEHRTNMNAVEDIAQLENKKWDTGNGLAVNSERQPLLEEDSTKEFSKKEQTSPEQVQEVFAEIKNTDSLPFDQNMTQGGTVISDLTSNSTKGLPSNLYVSLTNSKDVNTEVADKNIWDATAAGPPFFSELRSNGHNNEENAKRSNKNQNEMRLDFVPIKQLDAETVLNSQINGYTNDIEATNGTASSIETNAGDDSRVLTLEYSEQITTPVPSAEFGTAETLHAENSATATDQVNDHDEQLALESETVQVTTLDPTSDVQSISTENTISDKQVKRTEPTNESSNASFDEKISGSQLDTNFPQDLMDNSVNLHGNGKDTSQQEATDHWPGATEGANSEEFGTKPKSVWDQSKTLKTESVPLQLDNSNSKEETVTSVDTGAILTVNRIPNQAVHVNGNEQTSSQLSLTNEQWTSGDNRPVKKIDPLESSDYAPSYDNHPQSANSEGNDQIQSSDTNEILHGEDTGDTTSSVSNEHQDGNTTVIQIEPISDSVIQDDHSVGFEGENEAMTTAVTTPDTTPQKPLVSDIKVETHVNAINSLNGNEKAQHNANGSADEVRKTAVESSEVPSKSTEHWTTSGNQMQVNTEQPAAMFGNGDSNDKSTDGVNPDEVQPGLNLMGELTVTHEEVEESKPNLHLSAFSEEEANAAQKESILQNSQEESSLVEPQDKVKHTVTPAYGTVPDEQEHSMESNETSTIGSTPLDTAENITHLENGKKITNVDKNTIKVTQSSLDNPPILASEWLSDETQWTEEPVRFEGFNNQDTDGSLPQSTNHESNTNEPVTNGEHSTNKEMDAVPTADASDQPDQAVPVTPENVPVQSSADWEQIGTQAPQLDSDQPTAMAGHNAHEANANTTTNANTVERESKDGNSEQSWTSPTMSNIQSNGQWTLADNQPSSQPVQPEQTDNVYATGDSARIWNQENPGGTTNDETGGNHDGELKVDVNPNNDILTGRSTSENGATAGLTSEDSTGETNPAGSHITSDTETIAPGPIPNVMDLVATTANDASKNSPEDWNENNNNPNSEQPATDLDRILNAHSEQRNEVSNPTPAEEQHMSQPDQQSTNPSMPIDRDRIENTPVSSNQVNTMEDVGIADSKTGTNGIDPAISEISQSGDDSESNHLVVPSNEVEKDTKNSGYSHSRTSVASAAITLSILLLQLLAV